MPGQRPAKRSHEPVVSVVDAVRATVDDATETHAAHGSLVAIALILAQKLDEGAGMATAAVAAELRATLDDILKGADDDDELNGFLAGLSSAVEHTPQPGPRHPGAPGR